jgi:RNA-directed DNA polymerase
LQQHRPLPDRQGGPVSATINLVAPLASKATAMRIRDLAGRPTIRSRSRAVSSLRVRWGDIDSANLRSTPLTATTPGTRTSTTATRTTGTRTIKSRLVLSADDHASQGHTEFSFTDLVQAYFDCRKHKRNTRSALAFEQNLEHNLLRLYDDLASGSYRPGPSICFVITRPKPREVWAANFRDRIAHHLLYNRISERFHRSFIADSCACIPGRGTLYAARRLEAKVRSITENWKRPAFYLKCDLANFFVSIDKPVLWELLAAKIAELWCLDLAKTILFHDPRKKVDLRGHRDRLALVPPHKSLFNQIADKGLPIGNLSSQFFANVLLDSLDQFVKRQIGVPYVRYVDDFVLLHESPQWLNSARARIEAHLATLQLRLNPTKTILQPVDRGIDFVGQVIKPWHRTIRRRTYRDALYRVTSISQADLYETANSYFGLMRQATHSRSDRLSLAKIIHGRGRSVDRALTKTYRGNLSNYE